MAVCYTIWQCVTQYGSASSLRHSARSRRIQQSQIIGTCLCTRSSKEEEKRRQEKEEDKKEELDPATSRRMTGRGSVATLCNAQTLVQ